MSNLTSRSQNLYTLSRASLLHLDIVSHKSLSTPHDLISPSSLMTDQLKFFGYEQRKKLVRSRLDGKSELKKRKNKERSWRRSRRRGKRILRSH
jgi:hypothetical protein